MKYSDTDQATSLGCLTFTVMVIAVIAGSVACGMYFGAWAGWLFLAACSVVLVAIMNAAYRKNQRDWEESHRDPM